MPEFESEMKNVFEKYESARAYCVQDVNLTRQVSKRLLPLRDSELRAWFYNERANDRGIPIDVVSALAGKKFVADLAAGPSGVPSIREDGMPRLDFSFWLKLANWLETSDQIDQYFPEQGGVLKTISRWIRNLI